jgi:hypothetical protein
MWYSFSCGSKKKEYTLFVEKPLVKVDTWESEKDII